MFAIPLCLNPTTNNTPWGPNWEDAKSAENTYLDSSSFLRLVDFLASGVQHSYPPLIISSSKAFAAWNKRSCQESGFAIPRVSDALLPAEIKHIGYY